MQTTTCQACGMPINDQDAVSREEGHYCCEGCANDSSCSCEQHQANNEQAEAEIPTEGIAGKEEFLGQEPGGFTNPQDREHNQRTEPNDDRDQGGCDCK